MLVWLTITLLALTLVYGVVHGIAFMRRRSGAPQPVLVPQTDLAILNWRREKSVFLGTNQPQEDASWIFQLRMAELERAKSGRTSEPRPWQRLAARLFDYAIWGLVLALLLSELRALGSCPTNLSYWLGHPLLAPVLITGSWVPIEALLIASVGTTPGKWLFGVFLQFSISDAYARRDTRAQLAARDAALVPRLVGRRRLRLSAARAGADRRRLRKARAEPGNGLGFRAGRARHARPARACSTRSPACAASRRCCGSMASRGISRWPNRLRGRARRSPMRWPSASTFSAGFAGGGGPISGKRPPSARRRLRHAFALSTARAHYPGRRPRRRRRTADSAPIDTDVAALFAERRAKIAVVSVEGPRMLRAGNWRRAAELCRAWTELELANADSYRCLGQALQAQGYHQDAIAAFRKAKQYDPDRSHARCGDRPLAARHRRGFPQPLPAIARRSMTGDRRSAVTQRRFNTNQNSPSCSPCSTARCRSAWRTR